MKPESLVGLVLAGGCALLLLASLLLGAGVGVGIRADGDPGEYARPVADIETATGFRLGDIEDYAVTAEAPLFNEDRKPDPNAGASDLLADEGLGDEPAPVPLDVAVRGIIITPGVKLAIITDQKSKESQRVREGMPLEGELGGWTLAEIGPRKLVFDGHTMGRSEVELQTYTKALPGGASPVRTSVSTGAGEKQDAEAEPTDADEAAAVARAEEIRRRVAERRAQLRAEAERRRAEQADEQ